VNQKVTFSISQATRPGTILDPGVKFEGETADKAWSKLEQAIAFRKLPGVVSGELEIDATSGEENKPAEEELVQQITPPGTGEFMFGLKNPIVEELLGIAVHNVQFHSLPTH
jgi:hypothetical protein